MVSERGKGRRGNNMCEIVYTHYVTILYIYWGILLHTD